MGERPVRRRWLTLRAVLVYLFAFAVVAGLIYLIYVFYRVPFFKPWLKWTLIGCDALLIIFVIVMSPKLASGR